MNFKIGDKVICIDGGIWTYAGTNLSALGPKTDEILVIHDIRPDNNFLKFEEYRDCGFYDHNYFRKLSDIQALRDYKLNTTILEDLSAPIKIGKGLPQREPLPMLLLINPKQEHSWIKKYIKI